jgi:CheY-like chemotaxis protein
MPLVDPTGDPTDVSPQNAGLARELRDALTHLYDYAYLERHPLAARLARPGMAHTRAQETRRILLDAIELLNPGDNVGLRTLERRAYALLFGLYVEGQSVPVVAESLGISGRQLRRDRADALEALAAILEDRYLPKGSSQPAIGIPAVDPLHLESRRLAQQPESLALVELAANLLPILQPLAQAHGVVLDHELDPTVPLVRANPTLVRQTLLGLASQAMVHAPLAAISIVSDCDSAACRIGLRLTLRSGGQAGWLALDRLLPDHEALTTLATALGGRIEAESKAEDEIQGSGYLWLRLPQRTHHTVLVVDDNYDLLELFRRYVAGRPYQLVGAAGVDEGLAQAKRCLPAVVVLDLMMPGRDGWEFLRAMREETALRQLPVIVCSVLHEPELALALGAQRVLKKPVGATELLAALEAVLASPDAPARSSANVAEQAAAAHPATPANSATLPTSANPPRSVA